MKNKEMRILMILVMVLGFAHACYSKKKYKPVYLIHGIMTGAESMLLIEEEILRHHPGTVVYNTDRFSGWFSLENTWYQVQKLGEDVMKACKDHPEGIHLLGYSQGGLLSRAILQANPNHCVKNFISLSSPQAGQFGDSFLHLIFPSLVAKTAYELFYSRVGQHTSVGNYWNDPHHQELYYKYSIFLPFVNNEIESSNSTKFRDGLVKLDRMILIGGPNDSVITPWESSHFGFYNEDDEVVPYHDRDIYKMDKIGLKTLDKKKKLKIITIPHVHHYAWHLNISVIDNAILPYLD
uniref:palmitoyl-CoA hydrolase n=1 Tax=Culicoides sonorensis TaxID=179676 RepID=A0A336MGD0_CULSO